MHLWASSLSAARLHLKGDRVRGRAEGALRLRMSADSAERNYAAMLPDRSVRPRMSAGSGGRDYAIRALRAQMAASCRETHTR